MCNFQSLKTKTNSYTHAHTHIYTHKTKKKQINRDAALNNDGNEELPPQMNDGSGTNQMAEMNEEKLKFLFLLQFSKFENKK